MYRNLIHDEVMRFQYSYISIAGKHVYSMQRVTGKAAEFMYVADLVIGAHGSIIRVSLFISQSVSPVGYFLNFLFLDASVRNASL